MKRLITIALGVLCTSGSLLFGQNKVDPKTSTNTISSDFYWDNSGNKVYLNYRNYEMFNIQFKQQPGISGGNPALCISDENGDIGFGARLQKKNGKKGIIEIGFGTSKPNAEVEFRREVLFSKGMIWDNGVNCKLNNPSDNNTYKMSFQTNNGNDVYSFNAPENANILSVRNNGRVGIGTDTPEQSLQVAGNVKVDKTLFANRISLTIGSFPDYVFEPGYKRKSLYELEKYIQENKHLPGIPSENEIVKEGLDLKKINTILVEKVEELTLYTIDQEKKIDTQNQKIEMLIKRIEALEQNK
ncbi:MAG: hypothetical protein ACEPOW_02075 [Bacteroidales bacterium]